MSHFPYRIVVRWSDADDAYVAEVPAMLGAGGDGTSPEEALRAAQESALELLEIKKEQGDPIPEPDAVDAQYSGQIRLRMPRSMHRELTQEAEAEGVSLNQWMVTILAGRNQHTSHVLPSTGVVMLTGLPPIQPSQWAINASPSTYGVAFHLSPPAGLTAATPDDSICLKA